MKEVIIKGYNQEKMVLVSSLVNLKTNNDNIALRSSIERRLREIDIELSKLITPSTP